MSGTRSPSRTAPATRLRLSCGLLLGLWPLVSAAVAVNLFLAGLIAVSVGMPGLAPHGALWLSLPLGLPVTWAAARWVAGLMAQADGD